LPKFLAFLISFVILTLIRFKRVGVFFVKIFFKVKPYTEGGFESFSQLKLQKNVANYVKVVMLVAEV
jgi:hypothetical protein|tara:strand:- start:259 stop:459 length:201 start_codon:yes stop_codon:yes gene_type:complete